MHELSDFIASLESGVSVNSTDDERYAGTKRVLKISAVVNGVFLPHQNKIVTKQDEHRTKLNPKAGAIIISRANTAELVGQVGFVDKDYPDLFLPDKLWQTVLHKDVKISTRWLTYFLSSDLVRPLLLGAATGTSGSMKNISKSSFLEIPVPTPPLPEQQRIATILDACDRAIDGTALLLEKRERQFRGLLRSLLLGTKRLEKFSSQQWREHRIGELLKEVKRDIVFDDAALYSLASVRRRSGGLFFRKSLYGKQILTKNLKEARTGDFLISKMQVVHGAAALVSEEFDGMKISGSYAALVSRDEEKLLIKYFDYLSRLPEMYAVALRSSYGVHIEKMTFNLNDYLRHKIRIPSTRSEQQKIVDILSLAEKDVDGTRQQLTLLQKQKKGLMQRLLTGQSFTH